MSSRVRRYGWELLLGSCWVLFMLFWLARDWWARAWIPDGFREHAHATLTWHFIWAMLTPLIFAMGRRFPLGPRHTGRNIAVHAVTLLLLVAVLSPVWLLLSRTPLPTLMPDASSRFTFYAYRLGTALLIYAVTLAGSLLFDGWLEYRRRKVLRFRLEAQLAELEISALRSQLDPELLATALEEIEKACMHEPGRAEEMIVSLGDLLRLTLRQIDDKYVSLGDEIARANAYLAIVSQVRRRVIRLESAISPEACGTPAHLNAVLSCIQRLLPALAADQNGIIRIEQHAEDLFAVTLESDQPAWKPHPRETFSPAARGTLETSETPETSGVYHSSWIERHLLPRPSLKAAGVFIAIVTLIRMTTHVDPSGVDEPFPMVLLYSLIAAVITAAAGAGVLRLASRTPIAMHPGIALTLLVALTFGIALLAEIAIFIVHPVWSEPSFHSMMKGFLPAMIRSRGVTHGHLILVFIAFAVVAVRYDKRGMDVLAYPARLSEALLQNLRRQLRPHFLFNSLNAVLGLLPRDTAAAAQMAASIRSFLARSIAMEPQREVTLGEELESVRQYLQIERHRLGERLRVEFDVDKELLSAPVPPLLLQPLVENSILHGISRTSGPGILRISARRRGYSVRIAVENSGPESEVASDDGIGLSVTRKVLSAFYGRAAGLDARPAPGGGFSSVVTLPLSEVGQTS